MMDNHIQLGVNKQLKRTVKDSLIYLPSKVIPAIIGILLIRILTNLFTPEEYGFYQITLSTFGLIRVFSMIWLSTSVTRFYLNFKNKEKENIFFSTLLICALGGAILTAGGSYFINLLIFKSRINPILFSLINLAIIASIFSSLFEIFVVVYRAGLEPKKYTFYWVLFSAGKPLIGIGLITLSNFRVDGIILGFLIVPLILDIIIFAKLNLHKIISLSDISSSVLKEFALYGIPISFSFLSFWILSLSDRYLIEFFRGSAEVGLYSVGYTISEKTLNFIYMILMLAAYPNIVANWEQYGDTYTQKLITALSRYYLFICMPILVILVIIPDKMLLIFSNSNFIAGARVLPFIAIGIFFYGLTQYVLKGFELHKQSVKIAALALTAGITDIALNIFLIPRYGFLGAGISSCIAYLVYFVLSIYAVRHEMPWQPPYKSILNIILAATIFGVFLHFVTFKIQNLFSISFVIIPSGVLIFFLLLLFLKEIEKSEIQKGWKFLFGLIKG